MHTKSSLVNDARIPHARDSFPLPEYVPAPPIATAGTYSSRGNACSSLRPAVSVAAIRRNLSVPWFTISRMEPFLSRREAHDRGMTDDILRTAHRKGDLTRLRPGAYVDGAQWAEMSRAEQYRRRVLAYASDTDAIVSHDSAAALLGLPLLRPDHTLVHFTSDGRGGGKKSSSRILHRAPLQSEDVIVIDGIVVTSPMRTALDVGCAGTFVQAVCAIESALRVSTTKPQLVLDRLGRRRGIAHVRDAVEYASPLTESIGESWSRVLMHRWPDIPEPRLQHEFHDEHGRLIARTDFDWNAKLVGESDGMSKYTSDAPAVVTKEKLREDAIRRRGTHVVRWTWADLVKPERLHRILLDGLRIAGL